MIAAWVTIDAGTLGPPANLLVYRFAVATPREPKPVVPNAVSVSYALFLEDDPSMNTRLLGSCGAYHVRPL